MLIILFGILTFCPSYSVNYSELENKKTATEAISNEENSPDATDEVNSSERKSGDFDLKNNSASSEKENSFLFNRFTKPFIYYYDSFLENVINPIRKLISQIPLVKEIFPYKESKVSSNSNNDQGAEESFSDEQGTGEDYEYLHQGLKTEDNQNTSDALGLTAGSKDQGGSSADSSGSSHAVSSGGGGSAMISKPTAKVFSIPTKVEMLDLNVYKDITIHVNKWKRWNSNSPNVFSNSKIVSKSTIEGNEYSYWGAHDKTSDKIEIRYSKNFFIGSKGDFNLQKIRNIDGSESEVLVSAMGLKNLMDFAMASIVKSNAKEFRIEIHLDGKVDIEIYNYYKKGDDNKALQAKATDNQKQALRGKTNNLLNKDTRNYQGVVDYLGVYGSGEDQVKTMGVWARGKHNIVSQDQGKEKIKFLLCEVSKNVSGEYRKDIMEMWRDWNDEQKINYCNLICGFLGSMKIKNFDKWILKWNRGLKNGTQSQDLNHVHLTFSEIDMRQGSTVMASHKQNAINASGNPTTMLKNHFSVDRSKFL